MKKTISIAMSCFNDGEFLSEALESIFNQADSRWQVVLVKDGGADHITTEIFKNLNHPRLVKYEFDTNQGPYKALNKAISMCHTQYILPMGADDKLPRDCIERILNKFESDPELDFTYGDIQRFGEDDTLQVFPETPKKEDVIFKHNLPGVLAYKKAVWEALGHYSEELKSGMADYDFSIGLLENGFKGEHIEPGYVYYYYRAKTTGHVSRSYWKEMYEKRSIVLKRHPKIFNEKHIKNKFLGFGALISAYGYGMENKKQLCRKYALWAIKYGYYRLGGIFMLLFGFPFDALKNQ